MQLCYSSFSKHSERLFFFLSPVWPGPLHGASRNGEWFLTLLLLSLWIIKSPVNHRLLKDRVFTARPDLSAHIWRACQASSWSLPLLPLRASWRRGRWARCLRLPTLILSFCLWRSWSCRPTTTRWCRSCVGWRWSGKRFCSRWTSCRTL